MGQHKLYWRFFNFMARRVVAVSFMVCGTVLFLYFLPSLIGPNGAIPVNGIAESDVIFRAFAVVMPAAVAVLGFALYRVRPWYPNGD